MRKWAALGAVLCMAAMAGAAHGVEVSGDIKKPIADYGEGADYTLTGDTTFHWVRKAFTGDLAVGPHTFTMETGGGNVTVFTGAISGTGRFVWNGGGNARWQTTASFLKGEKPNTFSGTLTILRGTLALAKPPGVDAVAANLVLGGGTNQAIVRLDAPNQIKDAASILITGKHEGRIWTQGHSETLGTLDLQAHGYINLGDGASTLAFAASRGKPWNLARTLAVRHWTEGKDKLVFGTDAAGLAPEQLKRIGFESPSGRQPGLYAARALEDGQLVPDARVAAVNPPFDVSDAARATRRKLYEVAGRKSLAGEGTRLKDGMRISLFGDSITWLGGFMGAIQAALRDGPGTKGKDIQVFNRGINGGGVLQVRDGAAKGSRAKGGKQAPFAQVIAADKATVALVYIGINDVWWRKTKPEDFERALRDIAAAARGNKTRLVLATLSVYQEKPDGTNPKDAGCDAFAEITRKVARSEGATLVDLRRVYVAYLRNHNAELRVDGSLRLRSTGVLTYDGVHPTKAGVELLADHIAQGIHDALER